MKILTDNKGIADALKSWLGVVTVILAGGYSIIEYIEHKQTVKVERSLTYVANYRGGNTAEAKLSLNQLLIDKNTAFNNLLSKTYKDNTALSKAYNQLVIEITKEAPVQRNIEILFSFFEEVAICVERELCDSEIIHSFFTNDAKSLFNSYYPYICLLRKQWKNDTVYLKTERFYVQSKTNICI